MTRVAAIQMVSGIHVEENLAVARRLIEDAAHAGARVVFLPENFAALGHPAPVTIGVAECDGDGPIRRFLAYEAARHGIWIVGGTLPVAVASADSDGALDRVRAACFVYDARGSEVARYDKLHLFDVQVDDNMGSYAESETIERGEQVAVVDSPAGRIGLSVCYDIRFPGLYSVLAEMGAEILSVPAAFTAVTGEAHWELLLRARAVEHFCFVVGAAQGGDHECERRTYGNSMIVDPWGEILARLPSGEGVITAELNLTRLQDVRREIPVASHDRFRSHLVKD